MADNEYIANRALEIAQKLRRAEPTNTDFADGWQQRYLDRQNERFERALEMARAEAELEEMRQHGNADDATEAAAHLERVRNDGAQAAEVQSFQEVTWDDPNCREAQMVVIERDGTGRPTIWCDPEIADLVRALNRGGVRTVASCSGHGQKDGDILLEDGRELIVRTSGVPPLRVLAASDPFCPACGHNRDASSVSSMEDGAGRHSCQKCGAEWIERNLFPEVPHA